jgi:hypothetical protein
MTNFEQPKSSMILYQTDDGRTRIQCRFEDETVWLTQALMVELFQVTPQNVTLHLKTIYTEGELDEAATCKGYLQVQAERQLLSNTGSSCNRVGKKQHKIGIDWLWITRNRVFIGIRNLA